MSFFVQYHALLTYHQFKYISYSYLVFIVDSFQQKREICHILKRSLDLLQDKSILK